MLKKEGAKQTSIRLLKSIDVKQPLLDLHKVQDTDQLQIQKPGVNKVKPVPAAPSV
jgi:hypothetical protein